MLCLQAADSIEVAKAAPFVEKLVADGYEVLYLTEAIDEAMVTNLAKFGDKELIDVSKEGINLGSEEDAKKVCVAECMLLVRAGGCCGLYVVLVGSQVREVAYAVWTYAVGRVSETSWRLLLASPRVNMPSR